MTNKSALLEVASLLEERALEAAQPAVTKPTLHSAYLPYLEFADRSLRIAAALRALAQEKGE